MTELIRPPTKITVSHGIFGQSTGANMKHNAAGRTNDQPPTAKADLDMTGSWPSAADLAAIAAAEDGGRAMAT